MSKTKSVKTSTQIQKIKLNQTKLKKQKQKCTKITYRGKKHKTAARTMDFKIKAYPKQQQNYYTEHVPRPLVP